MTPHFPDAPSWRLGCLRQVFARFGIAMPIDAATPEALPYGVSDRFMSAAELAFYRVLLGVVDRERYVVCVKVNVADVLYVKRPHENKGAEPDRSQARGFSDRGRGDDEAAGGGGVDDASHQRPSPRERDAFMDRAFAAAGLPLLHARARRTYDTRVLAGRIEAALAEK